MRMNAGGEQRRRQIHEVAAALGLTATQDGFAGKLGDVEVWIDAKDGLVSAWTGRIPGGASVLSGTFATESEDTFDAGDRGFDGEFTMVGNRALAFAWLDAETRAALLGLHEHAIGVRIGWKMLRVKPHDTEPRFLTWVLKTAAILAARISMTEEELPPRLAYVAMSDPEAGVRARALEALVLAFPATAVSLNAARALLEDPDERVGIVAAAEVGYAAAIDRALFSTDHGLRAFAARFIERRDVAPSPRALHAALDPVPRAPIATILIRALMRSTHPDAASALIELAGKRKLRPLILGALGAPDVKTALAMIRERYHLSESPGALSLSGRGGELSAAPQPGALSDPSASA